MIYHIPGTEDFTLLLLLLLGIKFFHHNFLRHKQSKHFIDGSICLLVSISFGLIFLKYGLLPSVALVLLGLFILAQHIILFKNSKKLEIS